MFTIISLLDTSLEVEIKKLTKIGLLHNCHLTSITQNKS